MLCPKHSRLGALLSKSCGMEGQQLKTQDHGGGHRSQFTTTVETSGEKQQISHAEFSTAVETRQEDRWRPREDPTMMCTVTLFSSRMPSLDEWFLWADSKNRHQRLWKDCRLGEILPQSLTDSPISMTLISDFFHSKYSSASHYKRCNRSNH